MSRLQENNIYKIMLVEVFLESMTSDEIREKYIKDRRVDRAVVRLLADAKENGVLLNKKDAFEFLEYCNEDIDEEYADFFDEIPSNDN